MQVLSNCRDFSLLSQSQLVDFFSSERLKISSERVVYRAVVSWVGSAAEERAKGIPALLEHVNFPLMSERELHECADDSMATATGRGRRRRKTSTPRKKALEVTAAAEVKKYLGRPPEERVAYWAERRKPARWPKIFVALRMYWRNLPMEYYDFAAGEWRPLAPVRHWRSCGALAGHRSVVYLVGGEEADADSPTGSRTVNRVTRFDCEQERWSTAPAMNLARRWAASAVIGDMLYIIG